MTDLVQVYREIRLLGIMARYRYTLYIQKVKASLEDKLTNGLTENE